jgi:hypothetical protein
MADGVEGQAVPDLAHNPEAKGRGLAKGDQEGEKQVTRPPATSGRECSGQKMPDYSRGRLSEALGSWGSGNLGGGGFG